MKFIFPGSFLQSSSEPDGYLKFSSLKNEVLQTLKYAALKLSKYNYILKEKYMVWSGISDDNFY